MPSTQRSLTLSGQIWRLVTDGAAWLVQGFPTQLGVVLRRKIYARLLASCGICDIATGVELTGLQNIRIGDGVSINRGCTLLAADSSLDIGENTHLNKNVRIGAEGGGSVRIGRDVQIGPNTVIDPSAHRFAQANVPIREQGMEYGHIVVEDNVWIGANVVIVRDTRIGEGCVIGAGAVVTRDIEPYSVAGGVPAKVLRKRTGA